MTCKGYDVKSVKISKSVKRLAANILDDHKRGAFIRDYVRAEEANRVLSKRSKKDKSE
jgi:hypothetical protein